ncbi:hypothetical protein [Niveibacterium sp.]|uniref:hypothetical protein n=1 Tax=Niveibacterium sp. TaxID=2017444 RepID=UPI0035AEBAA5
MNIRLIAATALALSATVAHADPVTINPPPKHECKQPSPLGMEPSTAQIKSYNKAFDAYKACMQTYITDRQAAGNKIAELYKAEVEAGNAAIKEFNDWANTVKSDKDK